MGIGLARFVVQDAPYAFEMETYAGTVVLELIGSRCHVSYAARSDSLETLHAEFFVKPESMA
jgi:hypothetical protein